MEQEHKVQLRIFEDTDIKLLCNWLNMEYVKRWFGNPADWITEIKGRHNKYKWIHHYIAELNNEAIGFCQFYEYKMGGETWHGNVDIDGAYSIDYLIGNPEYIGKGLSREMINALIDKIALQNNSKQIIVQPDSENRASRAALLSSGFCYDDKNKLFTYLLVH